MKASSMDQPADSIPEGIPEDIPAVYHRKVHGSA
jgi:hypothetical protein